MVSQTYQSYSDGCCTESDNLFSPLAFFESNMRFVSWKDYKAVVAQLKAVYQAPTEQQALEQFEKDWQDKYPVIAEMWHRNWDKPIMMFNYPDDIRRVIYTINAIESVNSSIRKATTRH